MTGSFDPLLVVLSFVIATLASYAALDLAGRVTAATGAARLVWLIGGATAMGLGIWSMHFVAMLAFHLPVPIAYGLPLMLLSVAVAIAASLLALYVVSRPALGVSALVPAGTIMGLAIAGMHYIGMASMYMNATLSYNYWIVGLSVVIAIVASTAALWLAFKFRTDTEPRWRLMKGASAIVMGVAIAGMHYTGMAAAHFSHVATMVPSRGNVLATYELAAAIVVGAFLISALAIIGAVVDRAMHRRAAVNARLLEQATQLEAQFTEARALAAKLERANLELQNALKTAEEAREETERTAKALRESEERLQHSQRMEAIGNLAGGIAHDFNNLLTVMRLNAEMLSEVTPAERSSDIEELLHSINRAGALTQQLLAYGRRQFMNPTSLSLNTVVKRLGTMIRRLIPENIDIRLDLEPDLGLAHLDQGQMEQIITNLVLNARSAMPSGGKLVIRTRTVSHAGYAGHQASPGSASVMLSVEDNGHGMSKEVQQHAFEPFFTTRPQGEGSGLGLSMVYGIVKQSGGDVTIESVEGQGTTVRVFFPRLAGAEEAPEECETCEQPHFGKERILLVEDQEAVRVAARRIMTARGYTVLEAENGADALARYGDGCETCDTFDVVVTDLVMPQMGGRELVARLREKRPGCPAIYMSGYSIEGVPSEADANVPIIRKPFSAVDLSNAVRAALDNKHRSGSRSSLRLVSSPRG